eukprot:TRINITY_DN733_c0_g1_i2.p1 TRINITY_DN733_c0_g1~~TRINITY_DN733_c0_g1_i2.p1  ORF type:complete len:202 (-),score=28.67 TRINITY_DN733_c0_g1_i2:35-640(-)
MGFHFNLKQQLPLIILEVLLVYSFIVGIVGVASTEKDWAGVEYDYMSTTIKVTFGWQSQCSVVLGTETCIKYKDIDNKSSDYKDIEGGGQAAVAGSSLVLAASIILFCLVAALIFFSHHSRARLLTLIIGGLLVVTLVITTLTWIIYVGKTNSAYQDMPQAAFYGAAFILAVINTVALLVATILAFVSFGFAARGGYSSLH